MLKACLLVAAALCGAAQAAASASWDQPMTTTQLRAEWKDRAFPGLVPLGKDRFLLHTREGLRLWDANTTQFLPLKVDPAAAAGAPDRLRDSATLRAGTLMVGLAHDQRLAMVWGWNAATESLTLPLALPPGWETSWYMVGLLRLDAQHALVCFPGKGSQVVRWGSQTLAPTWAPHGDADARSALQARGAVGPVQGFGTLSLPAALAPRLPVYYDTQRCAWELTQPPPELALHLDRQRLRGERPTIQPHFLDDGRVLVSQMEYFDAVKAHRVRISNPLLWDADANAWRSLAALGSNAYPCIGCTGNQQPVLALHWADQFVEALHLPTLTWRRFNERLPGYFVRLYPLQSGQVLVVSASESAPVPIVMGRITLSDGTVPPGHLHFSRHGLNVADYGQAIAAGRHIVLIGGSDASEWVDVATAQSTELPRLPAGSHWPAWTTGVALPDGGVLVLGGLPVDCRRESPFESLPKGICENRVGQPTWRYSPAGKRWEAVPTLRIPFSWGPRYRHTDWPRADLSVRSNGDLVWLQGGEFPESRERQLWPRGTALMVWSLADPDRPPRRVAALLRGRVSGSVVTLADGRLAVVGGDAQLERVALQKRCNDCPDEFVSIGPMRAARSTELLDESDPQSPRWVNGPRANFPGGQGFRLDNGRVVKVSLEFEKAVQAEVADAAFTQWTRLPLPPAVPSHFEGRHNNIVSVTAIGNRVLVMIDSNVTLVWDDDAGNWRLHVGWPGVHENSRPLSISAGAKAGQVLVRYPRTVRLLPLPKS